YAAIRLKPFLKRCSTFTSAASYWFFPQGLFCSPNPPYSFNGRSRSPIDRNCAVAKPPVREDQRRKMPRRSCHVSLSKLKLRRRAGERLKLYESRIRRKSSSPPLLQR